MAMKQILQFLVERDAKTGAGVFHCFPLRRSSPYFVGDERVSVTSIVNRHQHRARLFPDINLSPSDEGIGYFIAKENTGTTCFLGTSLCN
jgi:hypothetical protein